MPLKPYAVIDTTPVEVRDETLLPAPRGVCACGCGTPTTRIVHNDRGRGLVAGAFRRWIRGHNHHRENHPQWRGGRLVMKGYTRVLVTGGRYVSEHVAIAEAALGRPLPPGAVVHHHNQQRSDNRNSNLVICQDRAYHVLLHVRMRAFYACGHADWHQCRYCGRWEPPENFQGWWFHETCRRAQPRWQLDNARAGEEARMAVVTVGSIWIDKDKRMLSGNRRVRVDEADPEGFVFYRSVSWSGQSIGQRYRSRYRRFAQAFREERTESSKADDAVAKA